MNVEPIVSPWLENLEVETQVEEEAISSKLSGKTLLETHRVSGKVLVEVDRII